MKTEIARSAQRKIKMNRNNILYGKKEVSILKALHLAESKDFSRIGLVGIVCQKIEEKFRLISVDGFILLTIPINQEFWDALSHGIKKEFGVLIPTEMCEGRFFISEQTRNHFDKSFFEKKEDLSKDMNPPDYNAIIPTTFLCDPKERPVFSFEIYNRIQKIFKMLGMHNSMFYPKWNGRHEAAVYEPWGTEVKILAMPTRISEDEQWDNKEN